MRIDHARRIARAAELEKKFPESAHLLAFYRTLIQFQKTIFDQEIDIRALPRYADTLAELVRAEGPEALRLTAPVTEQSLTAFWETGASRDECERFFLRALLQPYTEQLAMRAAGVASENRAICPFCSAKPCVGVLRGEGEGGRRSLICSLCSTEWEFRRILCPNCGAEDKEALPVYIADEIPHVRVEACDHCRTYIKSVDLTRDGHAVAVVDELATVTLNIWADEHGYQKIETNLLGL
jgi:FdhE protein